MTKTDLIKHVATRSGAAKSTCQDVIDALLCELTDVMASGDTVRFQGFGSFSSKEHAARQGYNLNTGERVEIPARRVPVFRASDELKAHVSSRGL